MIYISGFYDEATGNFEEQLKLVKSLGGSFMCPRNVNGRNISTYTADEFERELKPLMDKYGVGFSSIGSPFGKVKLNDEEGFARQKEQLKEMAKIANMVGCKYIRIFSFLVEPTIDYEACFKTVCDKLAQFIEIAKDAGIVLLHENEKHIYGDQPDRCLRLYETLGCDNFKLIYDASNYIQCKADPVAAWELLKDKVVYYHIKDCSPEGVEVPIGMGNGNYEELIKSLVEGGYNGFMTLEPHTAKYAILKNAFNVLAPIAALIKPIKHYHRVFVRIDNAKGIKRFEKVSRVKVFVWQYEGLRALLEKNNAEIG